LVRFGGSRQTETALLLGFLTLIIVVGLSVWNSAAHLTRFIDISAQGRYYADIAERLQFVVGDITEAESQQRGYLLTGDVAYLSTYDASLVRVRQGLDQLFKLTAHDAALRAHIADVKALTEKRLEHMSSAVHFYRVGDQRRAREYVDLGRPMSLAIRERFSGVQREHQAHAAEVGEQTGKLRSDAMQSLILASSLAAIVLAFMALMIVLEARFIRALSERLLHDSRHDMLTALPNRGYANEWLGRSIAAAKRAREKLGLLYLDLNGFKQVNDTLGHSAGDGVLVEVSRRLERIARDSDFVARLGGDEFVVVMPRITDASQVQAAVQRFSGLTVNRGALSVGASVGCAIYPDDADTAEALMKVGDAAMYARKETAKRR
jgi:diguanylate cyclase (GGDEF)-like protein